jgi:sulfur-carrier protein
VTLRYWASLRAAAGKTEEVVDAATLADALASAHRLNTAQPRFSAVLDMCSVVVDGIPAGRRDHATIALNDGSVVELLPPFAGG